MCEVGNYLGLNAHFHLSKIIFKTYLVTREDRQYLAVKAKKTLAMN